MKTIVLFIGFWLLAVPGNKLLAQSSTSEADTLAGPIFERVEIEAAFPGGMNSWKKFLETNLRADVPVRKKAPVGTYTVVAIFLVDKEGNLSEIKTLTNHGYGMEKEVIRILKKSPRWVPAIQNGRMVKAYRKQPITFVVTKE